MSDLHVIVSFYDRKNIWLAAVMRGNEVMTFGFEATEAKAAEWGAKAMRARAWEKGDDDPPDIYGRANQGEKE